MFATRKPFGRFVAGVLLAAAVTSGNGCASWKREPADPGALLARQEPPRRMRVRLAD